MVYNYSYRSGNGVVDKLDGVIYDTCSVSHCCGRFYEDRNNDASITLSNVQEEQGRWRNVGCILLLRKLMIRTLAVDKSSDATYHKIM